MDLSTVIGIILAFALMVGAIMTGGPLTLFVNLPGLMIVVGGTFGCILSNYSFREVLGAFIILRKAFLRKEIKYSVAIKQLIDLSTKARKEGILSLQTAMANINDEFLVKGIQMDAKELPIIRYNTWVSLVMRAIRSPVLARLKKLSGRSCR